MIFIFGSSQEPVELGGYHFPADIEILPNIFSVHMDPVFFTEPHRFDPTRHLDASGKVKQLERFMPFSIGEPFLRPV